jgi:hypothetical protein
MCDILLTVILSSSFALCPRRSPHGPREHGVDFAARKQSSTAHTVEAFRLQRVP